MFEIHTPSLTVTVSPSMVICSVWLRGTGRGARPRAGDVGGPFCWARAVRSVLAGLLRRDIKASDRRPWSSFVDLDEVRVLAATLFLGPVLVMGPVLARAVLDLAAGDAAAGLPLAERLGAWPRIAAADAGVHDRVLAAHLAAHPPPAGAGTDAAAAAAGKWWDLAVEVTVRLLADRPTPEAARLAALVLEACPPGRAAGLRQRVRAALGQAPSAAVVDQHLLPDAPEQLDQGDRADGAAEPLASWLRVWAWSPVLPAPLLAGYGPLLAALRRARPDGPPDPRAAAARDRATTPPSRWRPAGDGRRGWPAHGRGGSGRRTGRGRRRLRDRAAAPGGGRSCGLDCRRPRRTRRPRPAGARRVLPRCRRCRRAPSRGLPRWPGRGRARDRKRDLYQDRRAYVWDNNSDTATLRNYRGRFIDQLSWGHHHDQHDHRGDGRRHGGDHRDGHRH